MKRLQVLVAAAIVFAAGCGGGAPSSPSASPVVTVASSLDLHIENGTTKAITVLVNGAIVSTVAAGQSATVAESTLPAGVWSVEARLPGGKSVLVTQLDRSAVSQATNSESGSGSRVDLSCGRLDVWVGVPMIGPAPGPGTPGDCDG